MTETGAERRRHQVVDEIPGLGGQNSLGSTVLRPDRQLVELLAAMCEADGQFLCACVSKGRRGYMKATCGPIPLFSNAEKAWRMTAADRFCQRLNLRMKHIQTNKTGKEWFLYHRGYVF